MFSLLYAGSSLSAGWRMPEALLGPVIQQSKNEYAL
jgi:hypothetical protein